MSSVHLHSSPLARDLLDRAADLLAPAPSDDPLAVRWVVQPGRLWERALRRKLADRHMAAGLLFGSLRLTLERALNLLGPQPTLMSEDDLFWSLLRLLCLHADDLNAIGLTPDTPPCQWLSQRDQDASLSRVQLARLLQTILDDHATHRPGDVLHWLQNANATPPRDAWIAALARALWAGEDQPRPLALRMQEWQQLIADPARPTPPSFPRRIVALLTGAQPNVYLQTLGLLALRTEVHLLVLTTCERGLADATTTWRDARLNWKRAGTDQPLAAYLQEQQWLLPGTLQSYWGASGIDLQQQLTDLEEFLAPHEIALDEADSKTVIPDENHALKRLQQDIVHTHAPSAPDERLPIENKDHLQLINAPSPLRELEAARDAIRQALNDDDALAPSDVLLILPNSPTYAPLLPAVFGAGGSDSEALGPDGLPQIPWTLADRSLRADSDVIAALLQILERLGDRITLPDVADLLAHPAIQAKLGFSRQDAVDVVAGLDAGNFRWGLNQQDRQDADQPGQADGMWTLSFALRRLAAGFVLADEVTDPIDDGHGVTPLAYFEGLSSAKWASLMAWAQQLERAQAGFRSARPLLDSPLSAASWVGWLSEWMPQLAAADSERDGRAAWIQRIANALSRSGAILPSVPAADLSAAAFVSLLKETVSAFEEALPIGRGRGGVTVASPRMARALPARMVIVAGLSDGVWPRPDTAHPRGLLTTRLPGDRVRRADDKLATLEWLLAAEDRMVWTWTGRNLHRGQSVPASVVVGELKEVCAATFADADFERHVKLHAFDPAHFDATTTGSFDQVALAAARRMSDNSCYSFSRYSQGNREVAPPARIGRIRDVQEPSGGTRSVASSESEAKSIGNGSGWRPLPTPTDLWDIPDLRAFALGADVPDTWSTETWSALADRLVRFFDLPCKSYLYHVGIDIEEEVDLLPDREALSLSGLTKWQVQDQILRELIELGPEPAHLDRLKNRLQRAGLLPPGPATEEEWDTLADTACDILQRAASVGADPDSRVVHIHEMTWSPTSHLVRVSISEFKERRSLRAYIEQCVLACQQNAPVQTTLVDSRKGPYRIPAIAPDAAQQQVRQWCALAMLGHIVPLPFFPAASAVWHKKHQLTACHDTFYEAQPNRSPPEIAKPAVRMAFRQREPLTDPWPDGIDADLMAAANLPDGDSPFCVIADALYGFIDDLERVSAKKQKGAAS